MDMTTRRTFLRLLGIGAPAAAVATQLPAAQTNPSDVNSAARVQFGPWQPSYSDVGTREDLEALIYDVPPIEAPYEIGHRRFRTVPGKHFVEVWDGERWLTEAAQPSGRHD